MLISFRTKCEVITWNKIFYQKILNGLVSFKVSPDRNDFSPLKNVAFRFLSSVSLAVQQTPSSIFIYLHMIFRQIEFE